MTSIALHAEFRTAAEIMWSAYCQAPKDSMWRRIAEAKYNRYEAAARYLRERARRV